MYKYTKKSHNIANALKIDFDVTCVLGLKFDVLNLERTIPQKNKLMMPDNCNDSANE